MTLTLPAELNDLKYIVGMEFPQADEDALWRCARAWQNAAGQLRQVGAAATGAGDQVAAALDATTGAAFLSGWHRVAGSDTATGLVAQLASACDEIANACERAATEVQYAKYAFIGALAVLAGTIAWLLGLAVFGGVSAAGIPVAVAAAQLTIRTILVRVIAAVALSAAITAGLDIAIQGIQTWQGHRAQWDWSKTASAAADGAIFGVVGGGAFGLAGRFLPGMLSSPARVAATAGFVGVTGGVLTPVVRGEPVPAGHHLLLALSAGAVGAVPAMRHAGMHPIRADDLREVAAMSAEPGATAELAGRPGGAGWSADLDRALVGADEDARPTPTGLNEARQPAATGLDGARQPQALQAPADRPAPAAADITSHRTAPAEYSAADDIGFSAAGPAGPGGSTRAAHDTSGHAAPDRPTAVNTFPLQPADDHHTPAMPRVGVDARTGPHDAVLSGADVRPDGALPPGRPARAGGAVPADLAGTAPLANQVGDLHGSPSDNGSVGPAAAAGLRPVALGAHQPVANKPVAHQLVANEPVAHQPVAHQPVAHETAAREAPAHAAGHARLPATAASGPQARPPIDPSAGDPTAGTAPAATTGPAVFGLDLTDAEAAALARQTAFRTDAGVGFHPADDDIRDFARAVLPTPGYVTVDLHGAPDGFYIGNRRLSPQQLATALRSAAVDGFFELPDGVGIKLLSCETAAGGPASMAAALARELGREVIAPDQIVWTALDGEEIVSSPVAFGGALVPAYPPDGAWHRFGPAGAELTLGFDPGYHGPILDANRPLNQLHLQAWPRPGPTVTAEPVLPRAEQRSPSALDLGGSARSERVRAPQRERKAGNGEREE